MLWPIGFQSLSYQSISESRFAVTVQGSAREVVSPKKRHDQSKSEAPVEVQEKEMGTSNHSSAEAKSLGAMELHAPLPLYPRLSRLRGEEGKVVLSVAINYRGIPVEVKVIHSSGSFLLDQAAVNGLKEWRFEYIDDREDILLETQKTIEFKLKNP